MNEPSMLASLMPLLLLAVLYWTFRGWRKRRTELSFDEPTRELFQDKADRTERLLRTGKRAGSGAAIGVVALLIAALIGIAAISRYAFGIALFIPFDLVFLVANAFVIAVAICGVRFTVIGKAASRNGTALWLNRLGAVGFAAILAYLQFQTAVEAFLTRWRHDYYNVELFPTYFAAAVIFSVGAIVALLRLLRGEEGP